MYFLSLKMSIYHFIYKGDNFYIYNKPYIYKPSVYKLLQLLSTDNTTEIIKSRKYLQRAETLIIMFVVDK